jgi:hypothetical protein
MHLVVQNAFGVLLEGYDYAHDLKASPWEFAVEATTLLAQGCTPNTLRWLVLRGYVEQTARGPKRRRRKRQPHLAEPRTFAEGTCYVLTALGASIARGDTPRAPCTEPLARNSQRRSKEEGDTPVWDSATGELRFLSCLVRRFRNAASDQRAVLDAFQRQGWPERVKDPLPHSGEEGLNVKKRLRDTVKNLNRDHEAPGMHFYATDAGRAVGWKRLV